MASPIVLIVDDNELNLRLAWDVLEHSGILASGFDGYLEKPIDVRAFPDRVRGYCRGTEEGE